MAGTSPHGLLAAVVLLASAMVMASWSAEGRPVPALFVFGDSVVDVGNNNFLPRSTARADFPPNGIDFPGGKPTGRFSNGYNAADYLAKRYGFKRSPPAFLSLTPSQLKKSVCEGINFASGGAGILNTSGSDYGEVIPIDVQLDHFRSSLESFTRRRCSASRGALLSKSIFVLCVGSNDLFELYSSNSSKSTEFISNLASEYKRQLTTLYGLGARRFGIMGPGLLGCCPALRRRAASGGCIDTLDDYSLRFNVALHKVLEELSSKLSWMKYSFGDGHNIAKLILSNPRAYGFEEDKTACCGGGRFNGEAPCIVNATLCINRVGYYFWDWYHPSAAAAKLHARLLYGGPRSLASPINFGELAKD